VQGFVVLAVVLAIYFAAVSRDLGEPATRTLTFVAIVIANIALICTNRSWTRSIVRTLGRPNKAFWWVIGGTLFFLAAVITLPPLQNIFQFAPVPPEFILISLLAGALSVAWFEFYKMIRRKKFPVSEARVIP
jgi:Ca2+-transporting ATPase